MTTNAPNIRSTRIHNRWPIAKEGLPFILLGCALTFVLLVLRIPFLAVPAGLLTIFTIFFFRDPQRSFPVPEKSILAPADGRILGIRRFSAGDSPLGKTAVRISIFMSIFDVHVNRVPVSGRISKIFYHPGRFVSANLDKASDVNENNRVTLDTGHGGAIQVVQIAGLVARRIACWVREGDEVKAGQRFGLIRFGSRLDVYLPEESRVTIEPGRRVKAGKTVLGFLP